jgi:hypothetical protein
MKRARRTIAAGSIAIFLAFSAVGAATAAVTDNIFRTANTSWYCHDASLSAAYYCLTDNAEVSVHFQSSVDNGAKASVRAALTGSYDATHLNTAEVSTPVTSGSGETDIIYQQDSTGLPSTTLGRTWCNNATDIERCDQHYIRFRAGNGVDRMTACHETGHAVGLTHGSEASPALAQTDARLACMVAEHDHENKFLGDNNADNINAVY